MAEDDKKAEAPKPVEATHDPIATGDGQPHQPSHPGPDVEPQEPKEPHETKPPHPIEANEPPMPPGVHRVEARSGTAPRSNRSSEWTASDDRGPLGRAEDEDAALLVAAEQSTSDKRELSSAGASDAGGPSTADAQVPQASGAGPTAHSAIPGATSSPVAPAGVSNRAGAEPKRSLWPVAAALILGAVIGAGSAAFVYRGYADDGQPDPKVASLTARIDALEKRPDPQASVAALKSSITTLDGQVAALRQGSAKPGAAPSSAAAPPKADLGPLNDKIAALQSSLDSLKAGGADTKALQEKVAALEGALAGMKSATEKAQAGVSSVESRQQKIAGQVTAPALAVVADSLVQQIDHGQPYATQVGALAALGADPAKVAVLRQNADKGVPSARTLAAKFEPLALPITATANKAPPNAGMVERLKSGMFSLVSIRRADDTSGTDLPSRVARIKSALAHDDVAGALDAWNALPAEAKAKADAWAALAKSHADAMNAARALQHDSIAALGTKKS